MSSDNYARRARKRQRQIACLSACLPVAVSKKAKGMRKEKRSPCRRRFDAVKRVCGRASRNKSPRSLFDPTWPTRRRCAIDGARERVSLYANRLSLSLSLSLFLSPNRSWPMKYLTAHVQGWIRKIRRSGLDEIQPGIARQQSAEMPADNAPSPAGKIIVTVSVMYTPV